MKQTAVEWLVEKLEIFATEQEMNIIEKAKAMEKEQIKFFFEKGHLYSGCSYGLDEIYNKTFKSE